MDEFAENLRNWRVKRGITQEALAETLQVSRQAVAKWESAQSVPDARLLVPLSAALRVSVDRLLKKPEACATSGADCGDADWTAVAEFLLRAASATYAGYGKEEEPSRPRSHDLRYEEQPYLYIDTYLGGEQFGGEEAVFENGQGIWLMNYCGRVLDEGFSGDFLKEALRLRPVSAPYRGPVCYRRDEYSYINHVTGSMEWFAGEEEILCGDRRVYECRYHGGKVSPQ